MNKFRELYLLFQHVFSASRRYKAKLLYKEWLIGLQSILRSSDSLHDSSLNLLPDAEVDTWYTHETREIDASFYKRGAVVFVEDRILDDGQVHAEHEYTVHRMYGSSSFSNESTHRSIFDRTGERIERLSCVRSGTAPRVPSQRRLPITRTVAGVTANLYGSISSAEGNYCHWFVDAMSRLFLIERFHALDTIDQVLVPPLKHDFQWDTLAYYGFDRSKIVELQPLECLEFENLLATSWPRGRGSFICPGWVIDRYNETLLVRAKGVQSVAGKRIYITRRDAPNRMLLNENEVCSFLKRHGFDIVELTPLDVWQKIAVFRDADIIVSQTGAGLTNLMFCHSNVKVLELVDKRFVYPLYASLAVYGGGSHHAHFFSNESALGRAYAMASKSSINIEELEKSLAAVLSSN